MQNCFNLTCNNLFRVLSRGLRQCNLNVLSLSTFYDGIAYRRISGTINELWASHICTDPAISDSIQLNLNIPLPTTVIMGKYLEHEYDENGDIIRSHIRDDYYSPYSPIDWGTVAMVAGILLAFGGLVLFMAL